MKTTAKVSWDLYAEILKLSRPGESRDETLRRILKLERVEKEPSKSPVATIKVSIPVREFIRSVRDPKETFEGTVRRLLGKEAREVLPSRSTFSRRGQRVRLA